MRTTLPCMPSAWILLLTAGNAQAVIHDLKRLEVDLTDAKDAAEKAVWSDHDKFTITKDGLGWDGDATAAREGWIQTAPLAVGTLWRTPSAVSVRVAVCPPAREVVLADGRKSLPAAGEVSVQYSPDLKHWSAWQPLEPCQQPAYEKNKVPGRYFETTLRVPDGDRGEYGQLLSAYSRLDVPWKSDEEAAVRWILDRDPDYFAKHLPLIGYVVVRFQGGFYGGQRIKSLRAEVSCGLSGLSAIARDPAASKDRNGPWRFKAEGIEKPAADPRSDLASPSQATRDAAAKILRTTYKPPPRSEWEPLLMKISPGDKRADVQELLRPLKLHAERGMENGLGGPVLTEQYRLDDLWVLGCSYRNGVLLKRKLSEQLRHVWVDPPAGFTGVWTTYFVNGQPSHEIQYKDGKYEGLFTALNPDGSKCYTQHYQQGVAEGEDAGYYPSGRVRYLGRCSAGKQVGKWTWYNDDGSVQSSRDFDADAGPKKLVASVGGFLADSYSVELRNGALVYKAMKGVSKKRKETSIEITPTPEQWRDFRRSLDDLKVWKWDSHYFNPGVTDGIIWTLEVEYHDHRIKTIGRNSYPDDTGVASDSPRQTKAFQRYLAAVEKLLGDKPFGGPKAAADAAARAKTRLSRDEAVSLAKAEAENQGFDLTRFNVPVADFDGDEREWNIFYGRPGDHFSVIVNDRTGKCRLVRKK